MQNQAAQYVAKKIQKDKPNESANSFCLGNTAKLECVFNPVLKGLNFTILDP